MTRLSDIKNRTSGSGDSQVLTYFTKSTITVTKQQIG